MVSAERSSSYPSENTLFQIKKYFFIYKNQFLGEKLEILGFFFFKILPNFSDFVNYNDCIGKSTSKSIRLQPVFI